jgi:arylsulfatase A-like enzyme
MLLVAIFALGGPLSAGPDETRPNFLIILTDDPFELYNLKDDPQEKYNLAATNKKVLQELAIALRAHIQRGGATPWQKPSR